MDFAEVNDTKIIINSSKLAPGALHELKIFSVDMTGRQSPPLSKLFETRKDMNSVENRFFIAKFERNIVPRLTGSGLLFLRFPWTAYS